MENIDHVFHDYIQQLAGLQRCCLTFLDEKDNASQNFQIIKDNLHILQDSSKLRDFLHFISSVSLNHYRSIDFFEKIEKIIQESLIYIKSFSNHEIFTIFNNNKFLLLFLYKAKYLEFDSFVIKNLIQNDSNLTFFYYELEEFIPQEMKDKIEVAPRDVFEKQREKGGEDELQHLIKNDMIEDFLVQVKTNNIPLTSKISMSCFETNEFLRGKSPSLIQYACFCGSIQIFKYLYLKQVKLTTFLWRYAIHGRNGEIIQILQESNISFPKDPAKNCILEAIRCHHNELALYLNGGNPTETPKLLLLRTALESYNFEFINDYFDFDPKNINIVLYLLCELGYFRLVSLLLQIPSIQVNIRFIL